MEQLRLERPSKSQASNSASRELIVFGSIFLRREVGFADDQIEMRDADEGPDGAC